MDNVNRTKNGGRKINRNKKIQFTFDKKILRGCQGDTLASALIANDIHLVGRSFKYHRPRGCMTAGSEEPNALVELRTGGRKEPNAKTTTIELYQGLVAKSQNRFPTLKFDLLSVNQLISPFLVTGFYYKTFMFPAAFWEPVYEKIIRKSAGLGKASGEPDPDQYEHAHAHCDVLVVGGGVAGLAAGLAAANTGADVIIAEEQNQCGGNFSEAHGTINKKNPKKWIEETTKKLSQMSNVRIMNRTTVFGYYDHNVLAAIQKVNDHLAQPPKHQPRQTMWDVRAEQVILACGAHERPIVFENNDLPGVMLADSVRVFAEEYGVAVGKNVVVCTNNDNAYYAAEVLGKCGVNVVVIADARTKTHPKAEQAKNDGIRVELGTVPTKAHGWHKTKSVTLKKYNGETERVNCDCVAVSGGYSPNVHLASQAGNAPVWDKNILGFVPDKKNAEGREYISVGACDGKFGLQECIRTGFNGGTKVAKSAGFKKQKNAEVPKVGKTEVTPPVALWETTKKGKAFVDFQNDVTSKDIKIAQQEGFDNVEHLKRYTTMGMSTDQGKISNVNGIALLAKTKNISIEDVGTTRFRPPYNPIAIAAFAGHERGRQFVPTRYTALHQCNEKLGAVFVEAGQWLRPQYYPKHNENIMDAIYRETKQVRETAGICDVSTLGKIDLFGKDAEKFLEKIYVNGFKTLKVNKVRYGVMLREDGHVFDDGTVSKLAQDHFFITTTTANAANVLAHLEHAKQILYPNLDVHCCSVTEQWCGVSVAGPNSREILNQTFGKSAGLSDKELPFMGIKMFEWNNVHTRVFRVSFSGELAYEINVPWSYGQQMWNEIYKNGKKFGLVPYGTEALSAMRIEKGHVAGNEIDGRTTLDDLGLNKMDAGKKEFIGKRMSQREGMVDKNRPKLVGIKIQDGGRLRAGAHIVRDKNNANTETDLGWVTSVCDSPTEKKWIGLALIKGGLQEYQGQNLYAVSPVHDEAKKVTVCSPHFFDPKGERLHG